MRGTADLLTVVAPTTLESWYSRFAGVAGDVIFIGEGSEDPFDLAETILARARNMDIRIFSGHDSLIRDWIIARRLRERGYSVASQSGMAVSAGVDKLLQKRLSSLAHIPTPRWGHPLVETPPENVIWKGRDSTQSRALSWQRPAGINFDNIYWESFVEGIEYSVVLHREGGRTLCFPTVWKGPVHQDLLPPWRRLRLVPTGAPERRLGDVLGWCQPALRSDWSPR